MTHQQQLTVAVALALCWGAVVVLWVAGALYNAARGPARRRGRFVGPRTVLVIVVVILAVAVTRLVPDSAWRRLVWDAWWITALGLVVLAASTAFAWRRLVWDAWWITALGLVVLAASTAFTLWARAALGTMWSAGATLKEGHGLRTHGPYGVTRHPIYTGMLGMFLATVLLLGGGAALVMVPVAIVFLEVKLRAEEQLLTEEFPDDYRRYMREVPRLVPGLPPRRRP
jgi:protein-S-isoprenylcysteine O-methyltransferase Ste14